VRLELHVLHPKRERFELAAVALGALPTRTSFPSGSGGSRPMRRPAAGSMCRAKPPAR
jgi:hypothetical protein